jgi:hypothetical protein
METAPKKSFTTFQWVCVGLGAFCVGAGALGMVLSFIYLASGSMAGIHAGTSGFLAGAILISGGVIALTLLSTHAHQTDAAS